MHIHLSDLRITAIILIYSILLGTSAYEKWRTLHTPDWFIKQFAQSFIGRIPRATQVSYWLIASIEAALALAFVGSFFNEDILAVALTACLFLFSILCFGLRIAGDYQGSANMFTYFSATLVSLIVIKF